MKRIVGNRPCILLVCALLAAGCTGGLNYIERDAPRYAEPASLPVTRTRHDTLRVVTFNIEFARKLDTAIALLSTDANLRGADVVLLQEMTAGATQRIARALEMGFVYYPAIHHSRTGQDFGNAVLSRWPIVADQKIVLPNRSWYARTQRTATATTIQVDSLTIRVYSTHLGTPADIGPGGRREQLQTIVNDAKPYSRVIIGGDMNTSSLGAVAKPNEFDWPTEDNPRTTRFGRWDHLLVRGLALPQQHVTGVALASSAASDHKAVWLSVLLP